MHKQDNYKQSIQYLESIRKQIDALNASSINSLSVCKELNQRVKNTDHICIIIALHNKNYLENLLKALQSQYQQKRNDEIEKNISVLYLYGYDCFFKFHAQFNQFFDFFKPKIAKIVDFKSYKDYGSKNERYQLMKQLLTKIGSYKNNKDKLDFKQGKDLNQFISKSLVTPSPITCFQQSVYTYIRIQAEQIHGEIVRNVDKQQIIGFCCKLHFQEGGSKNNVQTRNQNFHKQLPALPNRKILPNQIDCKEIVKKNSISYLNTTGGIFYLGIQHKLQKQAIFHGLSISQKQKIDILNWVLDEIVMKIFPPQDEDDTQDEKQEQIRLEQWRQKKRLQFAQNKQGVTYQHQINSYIFVDFINLYNAKTWMYSRHKDEIKYIVRIKVKLGDEYQVYHMINDKDIPQAYIRDDKKQKKLTIIEYYDEVYRRLKNKANQKSEQPPKTHNLCRFPFKQLSKK